MLPPEDIFYEQTRCMPWSLARLYRHTHEHTPCSMIGTDEPSANARAHVEALIYGSVVIVRDLPMCTLPCAFTHTHMHGHAGTNTPHAHAHMHTFSPHPAYNG